MKAMVDSTDFNRAISATKAFVGKNPNRPFQNYIRLEFSAAESCMTAMAVNGCMMSVEHVKCTCDMDGVTYIHPRIRLPKGKTAVIEVTGDETLVRCEDFIFGCPRIKGEDLFDWQKALPAEPTFRIAFNSRYLLDAWKAALASRGSNTREPVILEFRGPLEPVILRTGEDNIKMVLPIRIKE